MYLGAWYIDDYLTFTVCTHSVLTGAGADADSAPTYRIYKDETTEPILSGVMTKLDDAGTVGFYSERIQLTGANGFEYSKTYSIYVSATVGGATGTACYVFIVKSEAEHRIKSAGLRVVPGSVDAGTFTPTTTQFEAYSIFATSSDHYKYRLIMFTSGALVDQVRDITAYSFSSGKARFTCTAFTAPPAGGDTFIII